MKFIKGLFVFFLLIIIVGGVGFLGYSMFFSGMLGSGMNMSTDTTQNNSEDNNDNGNNNDNMNMTETSNATSNTEQPAAIPNPQDAKNREKLSKAIDLINGALEQITLDPYSNTTVSDSSMKMNKMQATQGMGTINIYPSDNSSVNIVPESETQDTNNTKSTMAGMNMGDSTMDTQDTNYVYDQAKFQQLHSGIYTIAQGILAINELSDELLQQSMTLEKQPFTYKTYVLRYNNALSNETDLEEAMALLGSASVLINVNPYASDSGYSYDTDSLKLLHEGVYKFAQGMAMLKSLKEDFVSQMSSSSMSAQDLVYNSGQMNMSTSEISLFSNINLSTILNIVLVVLMIGLIIGILGSIMRLFKHKPQGSD